MALPHNGELGDGAWRKRLRELESPNNGKPSAYFVHPSHRGLELRAQGGSQPIMGVVDNGELLLVQKVREDDGSWVRYRVVVPIEKLMALSSQSSYHVEVSTLTPT